MAAEHASSAAQAGSSPPAVQNESGREHISHPDDTGPANPSVSGTIAGRRGCGTQPSDGSEGGGRETRGAAGLGRGDPRVSVLRPEDFTQPYCDFLRECPTIFHAVRYFKAKMNTHGYEEVRRGDNEPIQIIIIILTLCPDSCLLVTIGPVRSKRAANTTLRGTTAVSRPSQSAKPTSRETAWPWLPATSMP